MLILTRRIGETLNISDNIQVTVLGVKGNQVRIGVTAPKDVPVHREEIYERIKKEKKEADRIANAKCTVCHSEWVDVLNGADTCKGCLAKQ